MKYPRSLQPDHEEEYELNGHVYKLPGITLEFNKWEGVPILNTFGGKPLLDYMGEQMFAELVIQRMATEDGWSARWVET